jgi:hypothetical protein
MGLLFQRPRHIFRVSATFDCVLALHFVSATRFGVANNVMPARIASRARMLASVGGGLIAAFTALVVSHDVSPSCVGNYIMFLFPGNATFA